MRDQVEALRRRGDVEVEVFAFPPGLRAYPRAARALRRTTAAQRFDVVHAHFGLTAWPALLAGLGPVVVTLHGNDLFHPRSNRGHARGAPVRRAARRRVARVQREPPGAGTQRRVAVLPVGIDLERFRPIPRREARERLGLDPDGPYLLFPHDPARPLKRFDRAQEAAGDVPLLTLGGVAPDEVPYWINAANAVLVPSQDEGFGLSVIEALACGVPAFGTPVGIHPVALEGIDGRVLRAVGRATRGAPRCAPHLRPPIRASTAARARELFSADRMAARVVEAWRGLLEERDAPLRTATAALTATWPRRRPYTRPRDASHDASRPTMNGLLRRLTRRRAATADEHPPETPAASGPVDATVVALDDGSSLSDEERLREDELRRQRRDLPAGLDPAELASVAGDSVRRGSLRRRVRYLRAAREVLLRDLGGFYYEVHRTAGTAPNAAHRKLLEHKAGRLSVIDEELRQLVTRLGIEPGTTTVVREPGVGGACPVCGELHGSDAGWCAHCGEPLTDRARKRNGRPSTTRSPRGMPRRWRWRPSACGPLRRLRLRRLNPWRRWARRSGARRASRKPPRPTSRRRPRRTSWRPKRPGSSEPA